MTDDFEPFLIWDQNKPDVRLPGRALYLRPGTDFPCRPDVRVSEQDRWQVLGEQTTLRQDERPAWVQANQLESSPEYRPGTVVPRPGKPRELLAIVYDFSQHPVCQPDWVREALLTLLQYCQEHSRPCLQLPLLGCQHGGMSAEQFTAILRSVLSEYPGENPASLLLELPDAGLRESLLTRLQE